MALLLMVTLAPAILNADNLVAFDGAEDVRGYGCASHYRLSNFGDAFASHQQNAIECHRFLLVSWRCPVNADAVAAGYLKLPAVIINDCVHSGSGSFFGAD